MSRTISAPRINTPRLTSSKAGICDPFPPLLLLCLHLTRPSDDKPSLLGLSLVFLVRCFCLLFSPLSFSLDDRHTPRYRHLPHASPLTTALWLATDYRYTPCHHRPIRAIINPSASSSFPLTRPHPFGIVLKNYLRIHELELIFNSTIEASNNE